MKEDSLFKRLEAELYNYERTRIEIINLELDIKDIENDYIGCGAITYEEKTGSTNKFNSSVENEVLDKNKKIQYLTRLIESKKISLQKIDNALNSGVLTDFEKSLVYKRYLNSGRRMAWKAIALETNLTEARMYQIRNEVIKKLIPIVYVGYLK